MSRVGMRLTEDAQNDRDDFDNEYGRGGGCSCHICPPCGHCTHAGNPENQAEGDDCWEPHPCWAGDEKTEDWDHDWKPTEPEPDVGFIGYMECSVCGERKDYEPLADHHELDL